MSFFSRIFPESVRTSLIAIAVAVIPVAFVVVAGMVSARKGNERTRAELNLDETVVDMCKRNPRLSRCMGAQASAASSMNSGGVSGCTVEPVVKDVSVQADSVWSQVQRVNTTVNVTMKVESSAYDRSSGALPVQIAQNEECLAALKEPIAKYESMKNQIQDSCRNNYDQETERLLANQNLLAAYKNKMKETPGCGRAAAVLGWSRTVADAATEEKSDKASAVK